MKYIGLELLNPGERRLLEKQFELVLKRSDGMINYFLNLYPFSNGNQRDDYYQEVSMVLWHRYLRVGGKLEMEKGWLSKTIRDAVLKYRRTLNKKVDQQTRYTDQEYLLDHADEVYVEEHIDTLKEAINRLDGKEKWLITLILESDDFAEEATKIGENPRQLRLRAIPIYRKIRVLVGKIQGKKISPMSTRQYADGKHHAVRSVDQLTERGEYLQTWDSVSLAAESLGISRPNISRALAGRMATCGGYKWRYANQKAA